jgi:type IV secretion system protein VirB3
MNGEITLYPSYKGLGRVAMIWGIPLMPLLVVACVAMVSMLLCAALFGVGGLLMLVPWIAILMFFKTITEQDDDGLRILWLQLTCVFARRNAGLFGWSYTLSPISYGRSVASYMSELERTQSVLMCDRLCERLLNGPTEADARAEGENW